MNDHAEIPSLPDADALEPATPKPRRRRAAPVAEQGDVTAVEAKPRRRRASVPDEAAGVADLAEPGAQPAEAANAAPAVGAPFDEPARAAPVARPDSPPSGSDETRVSRSSGEGVAEPAAPSAPATPVGSAAAPAVPVAAVEASAAEGAVAAPMPAAESADDASALRSGRGRRRGRRNRDRDPQLGAPEGEAAPSGQDLDDDGEDAGAAAPPASPVLPKVEAEVVFADVLSGAFDVATEPAPEEAAAPPRRVLQPEPDAPKLQKVLAQAGIGSRRDMEELILDGQITVNGEPAHIGQRISFGDQVKVSGKPVRLRIVPPPPRLIAYHKPAGEIVTHDDPQHRPTVFRRLPRLQQGKWQSVGRLDINTEGLLLFTNSGSLANQLMHPRFGVEREYAVRVLGTLSADTREELIEGVEIDGQEMAFRSIEEGGGDGANRWYRVVITEGRNREVRKLFDAVGLTVSRLIRIRYGSIVLPPGLKRGVWVDLDADDVRAVRRLAGGDAEQREARQGGRGNERGPRNNRGPRGQDARPNERQRGNRGKPSGPQATDERRDDRDPDDFDVDDGPIPNPLEQTFDKRFVQNPRSPAGGRGFGRGGGGFGQGGSAPPAQNRGSGPRQPDPLQTSVGYIGGDAYHRKGKGGRGGNRGGGGGGFGGGGGGGGFGGGGGGRRGR